MAEIKESCQDMEIRNLTSQGLIMNLCSRVRRAKECEQRKIWNFDSFTGPSSMAEIKKAGIDIAVDEEDNSEEKREDEHERGWKDGQPEGPLPEVSLDIPHHLFPLLCGATS